MIKYLKEFYKKSFTADNMKSAYLSAVKWYSTNVLSRAEFMNVHVQFVKDDKAESPTITIHLFSALDGEQDVMTKHCECCKEMHRSFFINEDTCCSRCSALSFQKRLEQRINVKRDYYTQLLRKKMEE